MPVHVYEAPQEAPERLGPMQVFLAGGITGCPDWQAEAIEMLATSGENDRRGDREIHVFNPRRADFDTSDASAEAQQIAWEARHLSKARVILFWFPACESSQPIALYELGRHAALARAQLAVGVEPGYLRASDVRWQVALARPDLPVFNTLKETVDWAAVTLDDSLIEF